MKKFINITFLVVFCTILSQAVGQNLAPQARRMPKSSDMLNGMPFAKPATQVVGDPYFNPHWGKTMIQLSEGDQTIDDYYGRYDLYSAEVQVRTQAGVRAVPAAKIKELVYTDSVSGVPFRFINVIHFAFEGTNLQGLFEVLADGNMKLLRAHKTVIKEPDYNPALSSGSRDVRIVKETEMYYTVGNQMYKVKSKKKFLATLGDRESSTEAYMKEAKLSMNNDDLIKLFNHLNGNP